MIKYRINAKTEIDINESVEGETIEMKIERITTNKEPIEDSAPIIYQERREGVNPAYNMRTDRFEIALDVNDTITASKLAAREKVYNERTGTENKPDETGGKHTTE